MKKSFNANNHPTNRSKHDFVFIVMRLVFAFALFLSLKLCHLLQNLIKLAIKEYGSGRIDHNRNDGDAVPVECNELGICFE